MKRVVANTLLFIAGFTAVFVMLGATATYLGGYLALYKTEINVIGGLLVIVLGLHYMGIFRIKFLDSEKRFNVKGKPLGMIGSFLIGAAFAFGWTPCIGPILSSILLLAANQQTISGGIVLLVVYSAGLGVPFLLTGIALNYAMSAFKAIKRHYRVVETISGSLLILIGFLIATNQFTRMSAWLAIFDAGVGPAGHQVGLVTAFLGGLLSFISPCVLPLVPAYISYISGVSLDELKGKPIQPQPEIKVIAGK
jgi:cytochrome c-type biogenesis protein